MFLIKKYNNTYLYNLVIIIEKKNIRFFDKIIYEINKYLNNNICV